MRRTLTFIYGAACYLLFLATFAYLIGFLANVGVPKSIDAGPAAPFGLALYVNGLLLALFGLQHSGMARLGFKQWWRRYIPRPIERSTYVLFSSLALLLLYALWQPMPEVVWDVAWEPGRWLLWGLYGLGWAVVLVSTFLIDHFDLFGLKQVSAHLHGATRPTPDFKTPGLYRIVRHPIMLGFLIAFWATPHMTTGHLLFAAGMTAYILIGLHLEERDLLRAFGERYRAYRERVPKLFPWPSQQPIEEQTA